MNQTIDHGDRAYPRRRGCGAERSGALGRAIRLLVALTFCPTVAVRAAIPAFPGAEGAGAHAAGGRGGDVYHVVNLEASGPGSLAEGLATAPAAGRTIVFDVSGYAHISGELQITKSRITLAGQTAPGDGFGLKDGTFWISGDDVVIRHLRFRAGHTADAVDFDSGSMTSILDHCSVQFGGDENLSTWSAPENMTFQYSVNAWGIESHSCGGLWNTRNATAHHTLWAHNHTRDPKARPDGLLDWINNVTFDYGLGFIMGDSTTPADWKANVEGCYFLCPAGNLRSYALSRASLDGNGAPNFSLWLTNSLMDNNGNGVLDGTDRGWSIATGSYAKMTGAFARATGVAVVQDPPLTAYKKVVSSAGALRLGVETGVALRDEVDTILFDNVAGQRPHHIAGVAETGAGNGGFGTLASLPAPADTDRDGMPDYWETAAGFNPTLDDHNTVFPAVGGVITGTTFFPPGTPAGYTYIEEYLHFMAVPHGVVAKNTAANPTSIEVDGRKFTAGFVDTPVFTVSNVVGGAVSQSGPGGCLMRFTPTRDVSGRAKFDFTVRDADGSQWTQTCALLVTPSGVPLDLRWKGGAASNAWDAAATNWIGAGAVVAFSPGDSATFDDSGVTNPPVGLSGTLLPGGVTVNAARDYTFGGGGSLAGGMALIKSGAGTLTLSNSVANSYTGGTRIAQGTIVVRGGASSLGTGPLILQGGGVLTLLHDYVPINGVTVPAGETGTMNLDDRMTLSGAIAGGGTLTLNLPRSPGADGRDYLEADCSAFTGTLNILGGATAGAMPVRPGFVGFDLAHVTIGNVRLNPQGTGGAVVYRIGDLSGEDSRAVLGGASTGSGATAWEVGGLGGDAIFAGQFQDGAGGTAALTKSGGGTLTLTGTSGHTGPTIVSNGTLCVEGTLAASPVTVLSNRTLSGQGALRGGVTVQNGGFVAPGAAEADAGTLSVSNGLTLNNAILRFDLSNSPGGTNDRIALSGGMLTMSGTPTFLFNLTDGVLGAGTYTLIDGGTNTSAAGVGFAHNLPSGTRQGFSIQRPSSGNGQCYVRMVVSGEAASLVWRGGENTNSWDRAVTTNWLNGAAPERFFNYDAVVFSDVSTQGTVNLAGTVEPRATVVSNSVRAYVFGGGVLGGGGSLAKYGSGTLDLSSSNAFTGGTLLRGGTIRLTGDGANAHALGSGPVTLDGGVLAMYDDADTYNGATYHLVVPAGSAGTLLADSRCDLYGSLTGGGTLTCRVPFVRTTIYGDWSAFTGLIRVTTDADGGDFRIGTSYAWPGLPAAALSLADRVSVYFTGIVSSGPGTIVAVGELSGPASSRLLGGPTGGRIFTWRVGSRNTDATFGGTIAEQSAQTVTCVEKTGAGTWTLTGSNTYAGGTVVRSGTLRVNNATGSGTGSGAVTVESGARLEGAGILGGGVTIKGGALLAPGSGVGTMTIDDELIVADGAVTRFELGTNSDRLAVSGDLTWAGSVQVTNAAGFGPGVYTLATYGGALAWSDPTLASPPPGYDYAFDLGTTGQVKLVVSAPPTPFEEWQIRFFGSTGHPDAAADADPDHDGFSNDGEFRANTNPTNGASVFGIAAVERKGNDFVVRWTAAGIRTNQLQAASTPGSTNYVSVGAPLVLGVEGDFATNLVDSGAATNGAMRFYRVRMVP